MAFQFPDPSVTPEFTGANGITYTWDATDGKWVVKGFAAESVIGPCASSSNTICDQLTELEEEIEALAPSVERGVWTMNLLGTVAQQGQMSLYDDNYTNVGSPTGLFKNAKSIWLNELDNDGTPHGFNNVEAGELIELFVQGQPEYGLYEVVDVHDETNGAAQWWVIEVNFVRTLEDTSTADNGDLIRVKIFQAPTGGNADEFVLKAGDDMTGRLSMERTEEDFDATVPTARTTASIRFQNTKADDTENSVTLYQPGPDNSLICSRGFKAQYLYTFTYIYGRDLNTEIDGRKTEDVKNVSIGFQRVNGDDGAQDFGQLRFETSNRLKWNSDGVEISRPVTSGVTADGFVIKGDISSDGYTGIGTNIQTNENLLSVRHNANQSAAINYYGRINGTNNITTKEYVDSYAQRLLRTAGLQLGSFNYRRASDSHSAGTIKSNTTTNPQNITELSIWKSNAAGIFHGADLYETAIVPQMFLHIMDRGECSYVGKITAVEKIDNGVKLTLDVVSGDTSGSIYYNNSYDVTISCNRYGVNLFPHGN